MRDGVSRRTVLRMLGAAVAAAAAPACSASSDDGPAPAPAFFTDAERRALGAFADVVIPAEEGSPGGAALGAVPFIERLLGAFEVTPPAIYVDGPFSDRNPFPNGSGGASPMHPPNDFASYRPLDRVTERAWRIALYGSASEGPINDPSVVPPVVGLRDLFKGGLAKAVANAKQPIETMPFDQKRDEFDALDVDLRDALVELVSQAAFGVPEYGGNPGGAGWALAHFAGDVMPLGYVIFDSGMNAYVERGDAPIARANPEPDPEPIDPDTRKLLEAVVAFTEGRLFS